MCQIPQTSKSEVRDLWYRGGNFAATKRPIIAKLIDPDIKTLLKHSYFVGRLRAELRNLHTTSPPLRIWDQSIYSHPLPPPSTPPKKISVDKKFWMLVNSVRHLPRFRDIRTPHRTVFTTVTTPAYQFRLRQARNTSDDIVVTRCTTCLRWQKYKSVWLTSEQYVCCAACHYNVVGIHDYFVPAAADIGRTRSWWKPYDVSWCLEIVVNVWPS